MNNHIQPYQRPYTSSASDTSQSLAMIKDGQRANMELTKAEMEAAIQKKGNTAAVNAI
ncbi:hypothetical protein IV454_18875 [Massilia antarctica]|uniref:Uncharacterized protein n=1 Tax=Massilia antarctica TaxID=2765360 RepID=A0AA48W9Y3_9BURK|nr:hypothetical protein [Massilia antarctica]QPI47649.1 hypothetical protein IV454_18875 [Massilia antarctica]